jgi:hypothetical protein
MALTEFWRTITGCFRPPLVLSVGHLESHEDSLFELAIRLDP